MKTRRMLLILAFLILLPMTTAGAVPLPENLAGYYKFSYGDGNTYAARVEQGVGTIKAYMLPHGQVMCLGVIQGDEIILNDPTSSNWARLKQVDANTALISAYDADTGDLLGEFSVVRITEQEADQIAEQNEMDGLNQGCAENLKLLGLHLALYAKDHGDEYPYDLAELYPNYVSDRSIFVCPARGGEFREYEMDYRYIPGFSLGSPNASEEPVIVEMIGNHSSPYHFHYVLYLDGHVESEADY